MIVVGRSEHPFMSICDLHEQLLLSIEKNENCCYFCILFFNGLQEQIHIHR